MKKQIKLMWAVSMVLLCVTSAAQSAPVAAPANTAQSSLISLNFFLYIISDSRAFSLSLCRVSSNAIF